MFDARATLHKALEMAAEYDRNTLAAKKTFSHLLIRRVQKQGVHHGAA